MVVGDDVLRDLFVPSLCSFVSVYLAEYQLDLALVEVPAVVFKKHGQVVAV